MTDCKERNNLRIKLRTLHEKVRLGCTIAFSYLVGKRKNVRLLGIIDIAASFLGGHPGRGVETTWKAKEERKLGLLGPQLAGPQTGDTGDTSLGTVDGPAEEEGMPLSDKDEEERRPGGNDFVDRLKSALSVDPETGKGGKMVHRARRADFSRSRSLTQQGGASHTI